MPAEEPKKEKRYLVAHARGPNFDYLKARGFRHMYPTMDDYVFLEDTAENRKLLRKQTELGIAFMKAGDEYVTISESELGKMSLATTGKFTVGCKIKVLLGPYENLNGVIDEVTGEGLWATLSGYNREYKTELRADQVVLLTPGAVDLGEERDIDSSLL